MRVFSGTTTTWALAAALLFLPSAASGQQADPTADPERTALAMQTDEEADREALRRFLDREDVRRVARIADVDLSNAGAGVMALEGERLSRAADQARALDARLGARDSITISATTVIIVLLLVLLIVLAAG